ncbi:MAG TPA: MlaD family protein [Alphaproteobacteria bacterium]|nr:MlaD family protein [Alphaproteobacteria bacterium]
MTAEPVRREPEEAPRAALRKRRGISLVWLVPLVAAAVAVWLGIVTLREQGPTIFISFDTAEGLEAGKTKVKYKDVEIGLVEEVRLSPDRRGVVVEAKMTKEAAPLMTEDSRFWVVRPRVGLGGVTGLGTLFSGAYIGIDPGKGPLARKFTGLKEPPPVTSDVPGREFILEAEALGSIAPEAPVYFNGLKVGQVLSYQLDPKRNRFIIPIFIETPHDQLVRAGSRFWNASGVDVSITGDGVDISMESLPALLSGGVAFDTPGIEADGETAPSDTVFRLFSSKRQVAESAYTLKIPYLAHFRGSVRGLRAGSPVEFRGVKVGRVTDVRLVLDPSDFELHIPVTFDIEPGHIEVRGSAARMEPYQGMAEMVRKGLRAQLKSGNILTGETVIALDFHPDVPAGELRMGGVYPEIPTVPTEIEELTRSVNEVLGKIAQAPIPELVEEVRGVVGKLDGLVGSPEMTGALLALQQSAEDLRKLLRTADAEFGSLAKSLKRTADSAAGALDTADATLTSMNRTFGEESRLRYDLGVTLKELAAASRSIRSLTEYLERHPEALIHGKRGAQQ